MGITHKILLPLLLLAGLSVSASNAPQSRSAAGSIRITRIRDGKVLIDYTDGNIDMWRIGSSYIRSKFGLYRSLAGGRLDQTPVGQSPLLRNESIWITDFRVYEKDPNPTPGVPVE